MAIILVLAALVAFHPVRADAGVATGRVAMTSSDGGSIFVIDVGTRTRRTVVSYPPPSLRAPSDRVSDPTWSPRGGRLAYGHTSSLVEPLEGSVRIVDVATRRVRTVLSLPAVSIDNTAWSPRGSRIAFVVGSWYTPVWGAAVNHREVHVIGVDGSGHRVLGPGTEPQWSPSGKSLAYVGPGGLTVVGVDPLVSPPRIVSPATDSPGYLQMSPRWSPDGHRIAFLQAPDLFQDPKLKVIDLRSGVTRSLRISTWSPPSWAPGGRWLAVSNRGIVKIRSSDGRRSRLTSSEDNTHDHPAWSTDGSIVAFTEWSDTRNHVMLADADTRATTWVASLSFIPPTRWEPG